MSDQENKKAELSTEPYRGVRDFYPEEMAVQNYLFGVMRKSVESFGYLEYAASLLEPAELFEAKSGAELAGEQMYQFQDRSARRVSLRPEMTPSLARMVARRYKNLSFPLRLFSIPNVFRYERPQRGRLREHWQLNADIFGVPSIQAEAEIIALAHTLMRNFGAKNGDFVISVNSRKLTECFTRVLDIDTEIAVALLRLIDKKRKMEPEAFQKEAHDLLGDKAETVLASLNAEDFSAYVSFLPPPFQDSDIVHELYDLFDALKALSVTNVQFDPTLVRGLDYYTGIVFEVFDTSPENNRSIFGGGRYDNLLEMFNVDPIPAVGFGMGDVTIRDFLETHNLLPDYRSPTHLYICTLKNEHIPIAQELAQELRGAGVNVIVNLTERKIPDQIRIANTRSIPLILCIGDEEVKTRRFMLKNLVDESEHAVNESEVADAVKRACNL